METYAFKLCWYFSVKVYLVLLNKWDLHLMVDDIKLPMAGEPSDGVIQDFMDSYNYQYGEGSNLF